MTNTTEQPKNHKIKFTHAENGEIDSCNGTTVFSNLFMIGALTLTRKYNESSFSHEYPTDAAGLERLTLKIDETIIVLSNTVAALGEIMAWAEHGEIDSGTMAMYGWLIAGLGELLSQLSYASGEISSARKQLSKQSQQNG